MNDIATALVFVFLGLSPGVLLMDLWWKRRIRSWRRDTLRKIEESRGRTESLGYRDEVDHQLGLLGRVQNFENLLRYYGGMPREPPNGIDDRPPEQRRKAVKDWLERLPKPEDWSPATPKLERGPLGESCVVFDKPQPHSEGCTCDTCWPDDPVLYSNEALDEAVKNGAVLREGPIAYHEPTPVIDFDAIRALRKSEQAEKLSEWRAKVSEGDRELADDLPSAALDPEDER